MRKSVLIKNTTRKEREDIVKEAKQVSKMLGSTSNGIADAYFNLYIEGKIELSEAKQKFIKECMKGNMKGKEND